MFKFNKTAPAIVMATTLSVVLPASAYAEELAFGFGVDAFTDYVFEGVSDTSGGAAFQPSAFMFYGGFYAGLWFSNVDFGTADEYEMDLILGYAGAISERVYYDVSYARFYYDDMGFASSAPSATLGAALSEQFAVEAKVDYNIDNETLTTQLKGIVTPNDKLSMFASVGDSELYEHTFWSAGVEYAVSDDITISAAYHGLSDSAFFDDAGLVLGVSTQF